MLRGSSEHTARLFSYGFMTGHEAIVASRAVTAFVVRHSYLGAGVLDNDTGRSSFRFQAVKMGVAGTVASICGKPLPAVTTFAFVLGLHSRDTWKRRHNVRPVQPKAHFAAV